MTNRYILYSDQGSGGVAVEAALTLMGQPYDLVEAPTSEPQDTAGGDRVLAANPMRQVPALVFPSGEVMTESAAILIRLGEHPQAGLVPGPDDPRRSAFLRWMAFVAAAIYSLYWVKKRKICVSRFRSLSLRLVAQSLQSSPSGTSSGIQWTCCCFFQKSYAHG